MSSVNEEATELKELHGSVHQLQSEVQQLRHERLVVEIKKRCSMIGGIVVTNKVCNTSAQTLLY
ncbi:hypothetical protein ACUC2M_12980 [Bacillus cytotoxicus]